MRARAVITFGAILVACACACACASAPPPPPAPANAQENEEHDDGADDKAPVAAASVDAPERSLPPSTKSYEEALSTPERLDVHDGREHLTDAQLTGPMRSVLAGCRVSSNVRVTIKTAVQNGRAIGVTINVRIERPPAPVRPARPARPQSRAAAKAEAKMIKKTTACVDQAVRGVAWPPSGRRDSFTTEF